MSLELSLIDKTSTSMIINRKGTQLHQNHSKVFMIVCNLHCVQIKPNWILNGC